MTRRVDREHGRGILIVRMKGDRWCGAPGSTNIRMTIPKNREISGIKECLRLRRNAYRPNAIELTRDASQDKSAVGTSSCWAVPRLL